MPGGIGKMELCYLASLLLCDKIINVEGAGFCGWGEKNGIILRKSNNMG